MRFFEIRQELITNVNEFNKLILTNSDLINAVTNYPALASDLIKQVLDSPDEFERLITSHDELAKTIEHFPEYKEQITAYTLNSPARFERLIQKEMLKFLEDPEEFKMFIKNTDEFICTINDYPSLTQPLMHLILYQFDVKEFERIFKNTKDLEKIKPFFPQYAEIFGCSSRDEAIDAVNKLKKAIQQDIKEVKTNARVMYVLRNTNNSLFSSLPPEITGEIIRFIPKSTGLSDKDMHDIIEEVNKTNTP
ncbi:MAG: hypothetical protein LEGION0403_FIIPPAGN_01695 [Legionella sp.]|uniref:hypothetical protein n=1 Tax=Legionella sp. TaxID=459 RepID=UPI003D0B41D6